MDEAYVRDLRSRIARRLARLKEAELDDLDVACRHLVAFFDENPILAGIIGSLESSIDAGKAGRFRQEVENSRRAHGDDEKEQAYIGYLVLSRIARQGRKALAALTIGYGGTREIHGRMQQFHRFCSNPLFLYVEERIEGRELVMHLLRKYKKRCEWFQREALREGAIQESRRAERRLVMDLYEFLHEQGMDFAVEPTSASGEPDLRVDQIGENRILAEAKVYWPDKGRGKSHVVTGFNQAYAYAQDFNEPYAVLLVFNVSGDDLKFSVPPGKGLFPSLQHNNKTIYLVVVDLSPYESKASGRGKLKSAEISEADLLESV